MSASFDIPTLRDWMTATEVSKELGITRQRVNKMILSRNFNTVHTIGDRLYVVARSEVEQKKREREASKAPHEDEVDA